MRYSTLNLARNTQIRRADEFEGKILEIVEDSFTRGEGSPDADFEATAILISGDRKPIWLELGKYFREGADKTYVGEVLLPNAARENQALRLALIRHVVKTGPTPGDEVGAEFVEVEFFQRNNPTADAVWAPVTRYTTRAPTLGAWRALGAGEDLSGFMVDGILAAMNEESQSATFPSRSG